MKGLLRVWMVGAVGVALAGCARMTTRVVEKPRVDQELQGNRGYLAGSAPATSSRKSTRQMIQTDIELPTMDEMNPWRSSKKAAEPKPSTAVTRPTESRSHALEPAEEFPQPTVESAEEIPVRASVAPEAPAGTTYTVKKGDNLEKIARKFYGSAKKWRKIYEANQGTLKSPDRLTVGQRLVIPQLESTSERRVRSSEEFK